MWFVAFGIYDDFGGGRFWFEFVCVGLCGVCVSLDYFEYVLEVVSAVFVVVY